MENLIGIAVFVAALFAAILVYKDELLLFANTEGFRPTPLQRVTVFGLLAIFVAAFGLFVFSLSVVKRDYQAFLANGREASGPPPVGGGSVSARELMQAAYEARGFSRVGVLDGTSGSEALQAELWRGPPAPDDTNIFQTPGALIYPDGHATQFQVAVIYGHDAWALGDELSVDRGDRRRAVTIRTAINRPLIRELIASNDYVLTVGLASWTPTREDERNNSLAHARAWNLGVAVLKLGWKEAGRIVGISLGQATTAPLTPALEPRQRAVIIVGVNASREVQVLDVIDAAARLINVDGVDLRGYSTRAKFRSLPGDASYRRATDINIGAPTGETWVLPAVAGSE